MSDVGDAGCPEGGHLQYFGWDPRNPEVQKKASYNHHSLDYVSKTNLLNYKALKFITQIIGKKTHSLPKANFEKIP